MAKPTVHFEALRRIAETASGMRYTDTWFVFRETPEGNLQIEVTTTPTEETDDTIVISYTAWEKPVFPPVTEASIASGSTSKNLLDLDLPAEPLQGFGPRSNVAADAVFWSASAVEKFLVPYYGSVYGDRAPELVQNLVNIFVPPGSPELEGIPGERIEQVADPVFAVVHLPSSEYGRLEVPEGSGPGVRRPFSTRLYGLHASGRVRPLD